MQKTYNVLSPDGFAIHRDEEYHNEEEVKEAIARFMARYTAQGYYSMSNRERLPLDEIESNLQIITN